MEGIRLGNGCFRCPYCPDDKILASNQRFKHHLFRNHEHDLENEGLNPDGLDLRPFKCGCCNMSFVEHQDWRTHIRNSHDIQIEKVEGKYKYYHEDHPIYQ